MSHSSGIGVSKALDEQFAAARVPGSAVRFLEVSIVGEELVPVHTVNVAKDAKSDWALLEARLQPKEARIFLFRLDSDASKEGYEWAFVCYVPDGSPVRTRTLFASSRDNCKKSLGSTVFKLDLSGSSPVEFTWEALEAVRAPKAAAVESAMSEVEKAQSKVVTSAEVDMGGSNAHAVRFPASEAAKAALAALKQGSVNLVQLCLDIQKETIELVESSSIKETAELSGKVEGNEPRFSVFRWQHEHDGAEATKTVFVYSCPENAPIKAKMLYSTVKSVVIDTAETGGAQIDAKLEIHEADEWTEELMSDTLYPKKAETQKLVNRPKIAGRGPRRQIK